MVLSWFCEDAIAKVRGSGWESLNKYKKELVGYSDYPSLDFIQWAAWREVHF